VFKLVLLGKSKTTRRRTKYISGMHQKFDSSYLNPNMVTQFHQFGYPVSKLSNSRLTTMIKSNEIRYSMKRSYKSLGFFKLVCFDSDTRFIT